MEEHDSIEGYFKNKFKTCKWLCFQNKTNNCHNKTYINKEFCEEHRSSCKKFRSNKKNGCNPCESLEEAKLCPQSSNLGHKSKDVAYETAVPNTLTTSYEGLGSRAYNCKFTSDGEKIIVTTQCGTAIYRMDGQNQLELVKVILCSNIYWTITDTKLSNDNRYMLQVTMNQYVQLLDLEESRYSKEFNLGKDGEQQNQSLMNNMRVYSLDLCGDNKEMVVGCSKSRDGASAKIFDLEKEQVKTSVICHKDDVNGVCYLDKNDCNIFISASDDGTSKLWDTRILKNNEPAGIFYGHVSGLTCVASKEDNRYFVTNSKDQSIKIWDIRKFSTQKKNHPYLNYDYRCEVLTPTHIQEIKEYQKKLDDSVMTFWGHQVHMTLIRCHFSPLYGTGQRYVYSGSYDGRIYIYDTVSGENVVTLELPKEDDDVFHCPVVRDCSWHPYSQSLVNTSFLGGVYRWEYRDVRDLERIEEEEEGNNGDEEMSDEAYVLCYKNNTVVSCQNTRRRNYS